MNNKLKRCEYGGNASCKNQAGSGALYHGANYTHGFPDAEVSTIVLKSSAYVVRIPALESYHDFDVADSLIHLDLTQKSWDTVDIVFKSLFDFDIREPEGIDKFIQLLPVLDPKIVQDVARKLWPASPPGEDINRIRLNIKGYLRDFVLGYDEDARNSK